MFPYPVLLHPTGIPTPTDLMAVSFSIISLLFCTLSSWYAAHAICQNFSSIQPPSDWDDGSFHCQASVLYTVLVIWCPFHCQASLLSNLPVIWWQFPLSSFCSVHYLSDMLPMPFVKLLFYGIQPPNGMMAVPIVKLSLPPNLPMAWWQCFCQTFSSIHPPSDMMAVCIVKLLFCTLS